MGISTPPELELEVTYLVRMEMPLSDTRSTKVRSNVRRGSLMMACSPASVTSRHTARFRLLRLLQRRSKDRPAAGAGRGVDSSRLQAAGGKHQYARRGTGEAHGCR